MMRRIASFLILLHATGTTTAFMATVPSEVTKSQLQMSLRPVYDEMTASVSSQFGLQRTDFTDTYNAATWQAASAQGTADWLAEASPQYLTGVSFCTRMNQNFPKEELMINIWMGPSYDTPHCLLTFGEEADGKYYVKADYVPRGATVLGSDPQYLEQYYSADVQETWKQAQNSGYHLPPTLEFESRMLDSPVRINNGGMAQDQAANIIRTHINRFQSWVSSAQPVPARSRGSFNLRDDKLRQYYFRGQMGCQIRELGDGIGQTVAAVNTGPTAEAYVGGGS